MTRAAPPASVANEDLVLGHLTRYPGGLSLLEIARALRIGDASGFRRPGSAVLYTILHLVQDGRAHYRLDPSNCPGGVRHVFYPGPAAGQNGTARPLPAW